MDIDDLTVKIKQFRCIFTVLFFSGAVILLAGCAKSKETEVVIERSNASGIRDNKPQVLTPKKGNTEVIGTDDCRIDLSNKSEGYIYVTYSGDNDDVKLRINGASSNEYTYSLPVGDTVIPLSEGDGEYRIVVYEGIGGGGYATMLDESVKAELSNEFGPYLYPNQYVWFTDKSEAISLAADIAEGKSCDLEVLAAVYDYVVKNIEYDHEEAENVEKGYLPDIDEVLSTKKGICFDYAALMTAMLRSQRIPAQLIIGYAGDEYHAWINVYIEDVGWIDEVIKFDGASWSMMDPTFAANVSPSKMKKIIKTQNYYVTRYVR